MGVGTPLNTGTPINTGTPMSTGTPANVGTPLDTGTVPTLNPIAIGPRKLTEHLLIQQSGVGENCQAGVYSPVSWQIDQKTPIDTKQKVLDVIQTAEKYDTRLRQVNVLDDQIDFFYLQPAYYWGFIPTNYYLHITANSTSLRVSLDKPAWVLKARNYHGEVTQAFTTYLPQFLTTDTVAQIKSEDLIARDAQVVQIISAVMYQVPVLPIANSFFVCYILPFLLYILVVIAIAAVALYFFIRKIKKETGFKIHKVDLPDQEGDAGYGDGEAGEYLGDEHVTHFKIPHEAEK